jgi:hypothetical protein
MRNFRNPPSSYGPIDCWWWEGGHLSKEKMRWELEQLKAKGVYGTWFYPRFPTGGPLASDPPYWSEKWWDFSRFSMEEHKRLGLESWFSDWTAHQFFQNMVRNESRSHPELVGKRLNSHRAQAASSGQLELSIPATEQILDAAAYQKSGSSLAYSSRKPLSGLLQNGKLSWKAPAGDWTAVVVTAEPYDLDYLSKRVVDRFLANFLERYRKELPESVGDPLKAWGPDEMYLLMGNVLYSPAVIERIRKENGYDITPYLAALFTDIGQKTEKIRSDYYESMAVVLDENFYQPIAQWLEDHRMKYVTIATWGRENLLEQTLHYGDFFRYMRWFQVTGNEDPEAHPVGQRRFIDSKLSSSIAHLNERERVAVCAYWGSGWGMSMEQNFAWTNENYAYGINLYNQHGGVFGLLGGWYEWVPPIVDFYQPYWRYWGYFTDYVRRLSYVMSQGKHRADVALLYPTTTLHATWHEAPGIGAPDHNRVLASFTPEGQQASETAISLMKRIYHDGLDFDVIDYRTLESAEVSGGVLRLAGMEFRVLVLPPLSAIRRSTLARIRQFRDAGGVVVAYGAVPSASAEAGRDDPELKSELEQIFRAKDGRAVFIPSGEERVVPAIASVIVPDVVCPDKDIFHTHQKSADADIYLLFNAQPESRTISATFRSVGEPELWNAETGDIIPVHRFERQGDHTTVRLEFEPYRALVVVFGPDSGRPHVSGDNLQDITSISKSGNSLEVKGYASRGGQASAHVTWDGNSYLAESRIAAPPQPVTLENVFDFELEPTMNNRWGDFRYPASDQFIGAEARRFHYMEEGDQAGTAQLWSAGNFDDSAWPVVTWSYGPYWWHLGPFEDGEEHSPIEAGAIDIKQSYTIGNRSLRWEPYIYSKKFGYPGNGIHSDFRQGSILGVSENFIAFDRDQSAKEPAHYLFSWAWAPREGDFQFRFGGRPEKSDYDKARHAIVYDVPLRREAWINGAKVISILDRHTDEVVESVHLKQGYNSVLVRLVHTPGKHLGTYAVFQDTAQTLSDPFVPLLRWFMNPQSVTYDITPDKHPRAGWYRFKAPPGLKSFKLATNGRKVEAWVDGAAIKPRGDEVVLEPPKRDVSVIALRIEQIPGSYAGAAFEQPVQFRTTTGRIKLGDWSEQGLADYSGVGVYSQTFQLDEAQLKCRIVLELTHAATVAEVFLNDKPAGVRMTRPFRFDITKMARLGENRIQVKVANTLANHMRTYPTKFVFDGQTISGLLGPVRLTFFSSVILAAKLQ